MLKEFLISMGKSTKNYKIIIIKNELSHENK